MRTSLCNRLHTKMHLARLAYRESGGIHPPIDDIPGRLIGNEEGKQAFSKALDLFNSKLKQSETNSINTILYPLPFDQQLNIDTEFHGKCTLSLYGLDGRLALSVNIELNLYSTEIALSYLRSGLYVLKVTDAFNNTIHKQKVVKN